jgi:DNA-binding helix-hairpin-helix protein with protein kinase domain
MQVTLADGSQAICDDQPFTEGGDGFLFWDRDGRHVIKLYKMVEPWRLQAADAIVNHYNAVQENTYWEPLFAWPNAIVMQPTLGIRMRKIVGQRKLSEFVNYKFRMKRVPSSERGTFQGYAAAAIKMARLVRRLHNLGLCHSDLSENNIFINPVTGQTTLLDCDGLVVPNTNHLKPAVLGTKGYMAPEIVAGKATPSIRGDLHALAVCIYRSLLIRDPMNGPKKHHTDPMLDDNLMYGERALFIEHPTDQSNRPKTAFPSIDVLGPEIRRLFLRAFVDGLHQPEKRPGAGDWERGLLRMYDQIVPCSNPQCEFKAFVLLENSLRCSWCGTRLLSYRSVPLLHFYKKVGREWQRDGHYTLVGQPEKTIHSWHVTPGKLPGPDTDGSVLARIEYQRSSGKWFLTNHLIDDLRDVTSVQGGQHLPRRTQLELVDGQKLLFGDPNSCRVAFVQFLPIT